MGHEPGNGKGEFWRWIVGLALAGVISYFVSLNYISERVTMVTTTEQLHFEQLRDSIAEVKAEVRELRQQMQQRQDAPAARPRVVAPGRTID